MVFLRLKSSFADLEDLGGLAGFGIDPERVPKTIDGKSIGNRFDRRRSRNIVNGPLAEMGQELDDVVIVRSLGLVPLTVIRNRREKARHVDRRRVRIEDSLDAGEPGEGQDHMLLEQVEVEIGEGVHLRLTFGIHFRPACRPKTDLAETCHQVVTPRA